MQYICTSKGGVWGQALSVCLQGWQTQKRLEVRKPLM